jgi:DNA helicase-2/ATP-dependent DNA helicase PcrA
MRGRAGALELRSDAAPAAKAAPVAEAVAHDTDLDEARSIAAAVVAEIAAGTRPESIAVLYRVNSQAAQFEAALADAGVSTRLIGATRFFDLDIIKRAVLELRSVARTGERGPLFQSVSDVLRHLGWTLQPPEGGGAVRERWEALTALVELADQAPAGTTLVDFVADLLERQAAQHEPTVSAVVLSTLHSAKGLEWESVHIAGLSEGLLPVNHARGLAAIDEERRLLYVGITRARTRLALSWSRQGLRGQSREPSRFLAELRTSNVDAGAAGRR